MTYRVTDDGVDEWRDGEWWRIAPTQVDANTAAAIANAQAIARTDLAVEGNTTAIAQTNELAQATAQAVEGVDQALTLTQQEVGEQAAAIAVVALDVAQNASGLATLAAELATVAGALAQAQQEIGQNTQAIGLNTTSIGTNTQAISKNTQDIAKNTQDIAGLLQSIGTLSTQVANAVGAVGGKVNKSGDTMTGNLTISNGGPWVHMNDTDNGTTRKMHHNDGWIGFVGHNPSDWLLRVNDAGEVYTRQFGDLNSRIETRAQDWANFRVSNINSRFVSRGQINAYQGNTWWEVPGGAVLTGGYTVNTYQINFFYYRYFQLFDPLRGWVTAHYA